MGKINKKIRCPDCGSPLVRFATYQGLYADISCQNDYCVSYGEEQSQEIHDREDLIAQYGNIYGDQDDDY